MYCRYSLVMYWKVASLEILPVAILSSRIDRSSLELFLSVSLQIDLFYQNFVLNTAEERLIDVCRCFDIVHKVSRHFHSIRSNWEQRSELLFFFCAFCRIQLWTSDSSSVRMAIKRYSNVSVNPNDLFHRRSIRLWKWKSVDRTARRMTGTFHNRILLQTHAQQSNVYYHRKRSHTVVFVFFLLWSKFLRRSSIATTRISVKSLPIFPRSRRWLSRPRLPSKHCRSTNYLMWQERSVHLI